MRPRLHAGAFDIPLVECGEHDEGGERGSSTDPGSAKAEASCDQHLHDTDRTRPVGATHRDAIVLVHMERGRKVLESRMRKHYCERDRADRGPCGSDAWYEPRGQASGMARQHWIVVRQ